MRIRLTRFCLLLWLGSIPILGAAEGKIMKVLPHYLDRQGRHSISPSLYERDAYQAFLRADPEQRSAVRFDVHWKAKRVAAEGLTLRLELRSTGRDLTNAIVLEQPVRPGRFFGTWSSLLLDGQDYKEFGELISWRASLWRGDKLVAEQKSFLW